MVEIFEASMQFIFVVVASLFRGMHSVLSTCALGLLAGTKWCFSVQHLQATALFLYSLGSWIYYRSLLFLRIGLKLLFMIYKMSSNSDIPTAVASHTLNAAIWATSSWPLHALAAYAITIGFRAWVSTSGRFDVLPIAAIAMRVQLCILSSGHINILTIAATCISFRACTPMSLHLKIKLISTILFGVAIYFLNPHRPKFGPVADLVMGISAYLVSTDSDLKELAVQTNISDISQVQGSGIEPLSRHAAPTTSPPLPLEPTIPQESQDRLCIACGDSKPLSEFPIRPTSQCRHFSTVCDEDLKAWIQSQLLSTAWNQIKCPNPDCLEMLQHDDMKIHASNPSFARYETLQLRSTLSEITDFCWCLNPSCDSGQIHPQGSPNHILTCTSCNYKACTVHNIQWHEGETCEQYDYRVSGRKSRRDERATERVIQQTTKPCPNCKANIEKIAGCDHMTCLGCRTEFCWICFADYRRVRRRGNTAHDPACRYHTGNLPHG